MIKLRTWISAARLRTLPLSVAGIITGAAAANLHQSFDLSIFLLAISTTLGLQILSNFANDYGDSVKGTDNHERVGPMRAVQSGILTANEMKNGIAITSVITLILAGLLIYEAFKYENLLHSSVFLILGVSAIVAAITYTVGRFAYGYRALGDIFVFVFFGLLSVLGSYFLFVRTLDNYILLPAIVVGLLSTAVLNLNNMRDRESDKRADKITLAVLLGATKIKIYHYALIISGFIFGLIYFVLIGKSWYYYVPLIAFLPLFKHLIAVKKTTSSPLLDPELKKVALFTFFFSILYFIISWF